MDIITGSWYRLYKDGWQGEIVPEAFSHPAKFSRGLIRRIYAHALKRGYLQEGQAVLDPFGGVGLGAADALANGLHFVGVELEQNFVDMGAGCDCTGISKVDWARCFGRWKRFAYKDGRHWCPRCLAEAGQIAEERKAPKPTQAQAKRQARMRELMAQTGRKVDFSLYVPIPFPESHKRRAKAARLFGADTLVASYERSSGKIPHTEPHYYTGNLDLFARHARDGATAVLVQGDSRRLVEVLEGARAEGIIASPPFQQQVSVQDMEFYRKKCVQTGRNPDSAHAQGISSYGTDPANLGNMPTGEPPQGDVDAVITSPPWASTSACEDPNYRTDRHTSGGPLYNDYGESDGQLAALPEGEPPKAVTMRCPYCGSLLVDEDTTSDNEALRCADCDSRVEYVDAWECAKEGKPPAGIVSSPPYAGSDLGGGNQRKLSGSYSTEENKALHGGKGFHGTYGKGDGQLARMREGEPPAEIGGIPDQWALDQSKFDLCRPICYNCQYYDQTTRYSNKGNCSLIQGGGINLFAGQEVRGKSKQHTKTAEGGRREGPLPEGSISGSCTERTEIPSTISARHKTKPRNDSETSGTLHWRKKLAMGPRSAKSSGKSQYSRISSRNPQNRMRGLRRDFQSMHPSQRLRSLQQSSRQFRSALCKLPSECPLKGLLGSNQIGRKAAEIKCTKRLEEVGQNTFWSAAKTILFQCHQVLAPGGVAIWVVKDFVRAKRRIDFTGQWQALCESCGFETIEVIRAWLVEDRGAQFALDGDLVEKKVERKSFFRRLYERNARAAKFWLSVLRSEQAAYLWQAHTQLWREYKTKMGSPKPSNIRPTHARITSAAHSMAYKDAGEPNVETDTQIDYEIVLVTRKV